MRVGWEGDLGLRGRVIGAVDWRVIVRVDWEG